MLHHQEDELMTEGVGDMVHLHHTDSYMHTPFLPTPHLSPKPTTHSATLDNNLVGQEQNTCMQV